MNIDIQVCYDYTKIDKGSILKQELGLGLIIQDYNLK